MHLLLASKSPRRRQLLSELGYPISFVDIECDEIVDANTPISQVAELIALKKAQAGEELLLDGQCLVTADTIVVLDGEKLGKPYNRENAIQMLRQLSGKTHKVYTGVCLHFGHTMRSFTEETNVTFRTLSDEEITYYVDHYKPLDKAGAYGIQEWIGMVGIERIEGDYYNVVGLPVCRLAKELKALEKEVM